MAGKRSSPSATNTSDKPSKKIKTEPHKAHGSKPNPSETRKNPKGESFTAKSSKEAHQQQKALSQQRKQAKPNADSIQRAKVLWERLRLKSHVEPTERKRLVDELFGLITGHVHDFVFKHDSVRTIQCAVKYSSKEQRKAIAKELKGEYKTLAEARYGKFLLAKLLEEGDQETRNMIISEFYGHVKRMINHPEASWILDDTYRKLATTKQKSAMLREWYGPEYAIFKASIAEGKGGESVSADLVALLAENPEKRQPIMQHLWRLINQLIQKNLTGFTILHDAMLQYSLAVGVPGPKGDNQAAVEFLELLKNDVDSGADLLKNIAFTPSGSRVVCRALACSDAKARKIIVRVYKGHIETLACDANGHRVLIAAFETIDDTVMTGKSIFPELLAMNLTSLEERRDAIAALGVHPFGRVALLYPLNTGADPHSNDEEAVMPPRWLVQPRSGTAAVISEVRKLRQATSKKNPVARRAELATSLMATKEATLLDSVTHRIDNLLGSSFGCQFLTEVLLSKDSSGVDKSSALEALIEYLKLKDSGAQSESKDMDLGAAVGRTMKRLIQGGKFELDPGSNPKTGSSEGHIVYTNPRLRFSSLLWSSLLNDKDVRQRWANSDANLLLLAMTEADEGEFGEDAEQGAKEKKAFMKELRKMIPEFQKVVESNPSTEAKFRGANLLLEKMKE
ncbi:MAG: pumilio domain member 6 [Alyxoria varia]|nr:MAG: pumilio domain member 6 [Alyxoria varia]